jgi:hypothetical protein
MNENRQGLAVVEKLLQVVECLVHLMDGGRYERSVRKGAARRADPVLGLAELTRRPMASPHTLQELLVNLADEAKAYRQFLQAGQAAVHGSDVVHDLLDVLRAFTTTRVDLEVEDVLQRALRPLDL